MHRLIIFIEGLIDNKPKLYDMVAFQAKNDTFLYYIMLYQWDDNGICI